ncbi:MAG: hypothetical protein QXI60_00890 [Thermofilaceae archaeon]
MTRTRSDVEQLTDMIWSLREKVERLELEFRSIHDRLGRLELELENLKTMHYLSHRTTT